ncbi:MAG TPA: ABC transporter permease [Chloroflexota bacterium]|jgi:peptide/nickel transport system permease protein|nr:ABC transporter permease [Chloroflexota bacterium]
MTAYIIRRLAQAVPLLLLISIALFGLLHLIPGGPEQVAGGAHSLQARQDLIKALGLDQPLPIQYVKWLWGILHLDFGNTYRDGQPVVTAIGDRLPATLELLGISFLVALGLAIPIGIIGAVRQYSIVDYVLTLLSYIGISLPLFWLAEILILALAVQHPWFPTGGQETIGAPSSLWDRMHHLILPVIVLALFFLASWSRYMRSSMLQVLHQEYLRTARAKGLTRARMIMKHALRNALIPLVTVVALDVGSIFGGAVVTEQIFAWPGLGSLFYDSLSARDYPVLMAMLVLSSASVIGCNIIADVVYALLDPRIRYT